MSVKPLNKRFAFIVALYNCRKRDYTDKGMFMQMMFLINGVFNFNMVNYIKVRFLDYEESAFYLSWEHILIFIKCFI